MTHHASSSIKSNQTQLLAAVPYDSENACLSFAFFVLCLFSSLKEDVIFDDALFPKSIGVIAISLFFCMNITYLNYYVKN